MDVTTQLKLCLYEQSQLVANAACRVCIQQFLSYIASYSGTPFIWTPKIQNTRSTKQP